MGADLPVYAAVSRGDLAMPDTWPDGPVAFSNWVDALKDEIAGAVRFDVTNVSDYLYMDMEQDEFVWQRDFPSLAPPFPLYWMEARQPRFINKGGRREPMPTETTAFGALFRAAAASDLGRELAARTSDSAVLDRVAEVVGRVNPEWMLVAELFVAVRRWVAPSNIFWAIAVAADGSLCCDPIVLSRSPHPFDPSPALFPFALAISFLHCKNVRIAEGGGRWPSRPARRAADRRGDPPPPKFYTLEIGGARTVLESEGGASHNGIRRALHIARGHFQTFSPDRPMFGKHPGTFWVPAHVRGRAEAGIVVKDYSVKAPRGDASDRSAVGPIRSDGQSLLRSAGTPAPSAGRTGPSAKSQPRPDRASRRGTGGDA